MTRDQLQILSQCWSRARQIVSAYRALAPEGCDPVCSWVAIAVGVGGAAISAGTTMYGNSQKKKAMEGQKGANYGQKPEAARYQPVDFDAAQIAAISANLNSMTKGTGDLMRVTNGYIDSDALKRANKFIPGYKASMKTLGAEAGQLVAGRLPYDDALDVVAKRGELTGAMGVPGTGAPATLRDLGLSRLDAIKSGAGLMQGMVQMAEQVNPIGRRVNPQSMFVSPADRIRLTMEQNQLIQQSDQSANNIEAGLSPSEQARRQIELMEAGSAGSDTAAIGSAIGGAVSSAGTIYAGSQASKSASMAPNSSGFYSSPSAAYSAYSSAGYSPTIVRNPNGRGYYSPYSMPV